MGVWQELKAWFILRSERAAWAASGASALVSPKGDYVLSLTSIRPRLSTLHLVIQHALRGAPPPAAIEIWLDESLRGEMTPDMRRLAERGCTFNWVQDIGPHTKLVYCLSRHTDRPIITIDDDIWLPVGGLQALLDAHRAHPGVVVSNRARRVVVNADGSPASYDLWRAQRGGSRHPEHALLPLGYSGVLYPPRVLDPRVVEAELFRKLCPTGDDLWFTAMRLVVGNMAFDTGYLRGKELMVPGSGAFSIKRRFGKRGNNDEFIARLFGEFGLAARLQAGPADAK